MMSTEQHGRRLPPPAAALAVLLVLAGVVALAVGLRAQRHAPQPPASAAIPYSPAPDAAGRHGRRAGTPEPAGRAGQGAGAAGRRRRPGWTSRRSG